MRILKKLIDANVRSKLQDGCVCVYMCVFIMKKE